MLFWNEGPFGIPYQVGGICTSTSRSSRSTVLRCEGGPLRVWKRFLIPKMRALYLFSPSDGSYWRRRSGFFVTVGPTSQRKSGVMTCFSLFILNSLLSVL